MRLMQNEPGRRGSRPSKDRKQPIVVFFGGPGSTPAVLGGGCQRAWKRGKGGRGGSPSGRALPGTDGLTFNLEMQQTRQAIMSLLWG